MSLSKPADEKRAQNWDGPYFDGENSPVDPWGNEFKYEYPPSHGKRDFPDISSIGPDGEENTEDDIVNWSATGDGASSPDNSSSNASSSKDFDSKTK